MTTDDLERIRRDGVQNETDREIISSILDEMAAAEKTFPGWFNARPEEFDHLKRKLLK